MIERNFIHFGKPAWIDGTLLPAPSPRVDPLPHRPRTPWWSTASWGCVLCAVYIALAVGPLITLRILEADTDHPMVVQVGVNCALAGLTLLALQFVLTARFRWVEAPFGMDVILRFHRLMALVIVLLLLAHPLLIASSEGWVLLTRFRMSWYTWAGRIALLLLLLQTLTAMTRALLRLPYERWRRAHQIVALAVLAVACAHAWMEHHEARSAAIVAVWVFVPGLAMGSWIIARLIRPIYFKRCAFCVESVVREAEAVWTVTLSSPTDRPFRFAPGQFAFLRFLEGELAGEEHPFTIASSAARWRQISVTIKGCGDFTDRIASVRPGDHATVQGPFGRFSCELHPDENRLVFIAGGVGITPLMSMLRTLRDREEQREITLIYATRTLDDVLFIPELIAMQAGAFPRLKVIHVLSDAPQWWEGERGRVDVDRLEHWCGGLQGKGFYLCGPATMSQQLVHALRAQKVGARNIHCDHFSL